MTKATPDANKHGTGGHASSGLPSSRLRSPAGPPRWAERLLAWCCPPGLLEDVQGDLQEVFVRQARAEGAGKARRAYWRAVLAYVRPFYLTRKPKPYPKPLFTDMLRNYLTVALRSLLRRKASSAINVTGLSIGLASCMLILLYTKDEASFDQFHANKDRLFRVTATMNRDGRADPIGITGMVVGPGLQAEVPGIEGYVRMQEDPFVLRHGGELFEQKAAYVDDNFFSVFSLPLRAGDPGTVLSDLGSVVLTEETARRYFGTPDAVGRTLELKVGDGFVPFRVAGVAENPPLNSSIQFEMLLPFKFLQKTFKDTQWVNFYLNTFVLLAPHTDYRALVPRMNAVYRVRAKDQLRELKERFDVNPQVRFGLQPFTRMHLEPEYGMMSGLAHGSNPLYGYILAGIALFILLIACINFVNLTVAQSLTRAKEIGIRKVVGGRRSQLVGQFLGESFALSFIAFAVGLGLAMLALPVFNELANKRLSLTYLLDAQLVAGYAGLFVLTGLAAGFYPALVLSGFDPVQTLYKRTRLVGKNYLAQGLVVVQFSLATFLIIATLVIYRQFNYLTNKPLGYDDKHLLVVHLGHGTDEKLVSRFKQELAREPAIEVVGAKSGGFGTTGKVGDRRLDFAYDRIDENYLRALRIPLVRGRAFSPAFPADLTGSILVNEAFVKAAGWKEPLGKTVFDANGNGRHLAVVGVVRDYHFASLKEKIGPQLFIADPGFPMSDLWIKIRPGDVPRTLKTIGRTFRELHPFAPFKYEFKDESNRRQYEAEAKWKQIITFAAFLTIFISCIGLFGLTTFAAERRTKEIGIRKVLGASVAQLTALLTGDFLRLVGLAFGLAVPAGWYAAHEWLQNYEYRLPVSWWVFALAGGLALLVALLTIGFRATRAALANPVNSLRSE
jgi:ABC-type antimicrobial peptide transport system permease subunit